jgi:hypothetical protein
VLLDLETCNVQIISNEVKSSLSCNYENVIHSDQSNVMQYRKACIVAKRKKLVHQYAFLQSLPFSHSFPFHA